MIDRHQKSEIQKKQQNDKLMKNSLANNKKNGFFLYRFWCSRNQITKQYLI